MGELDGEGYTFEGDLHFCLYVFAPPDAVVIEYDNRYLTSHSSDCSFALIFL